MARSARPARVRRSTRGGGVIPPPLCQQKPLERVCIPSFELIRGPPAVDHKQPVCLRASYREKDVRSGPERQSSAQWVALGQDTEQLPLACVALRLVELPERGDLRIRHGRAP